MLSTIVFLPALGAVIIALFLREPRKIRFTAAFLTFVVFALSIYVFAQVDPSQSPSPFIEKYSWIPTMGIQYYLDVDGLSLPLVLLTALLGFCAVLASWNIQLRVKEYFIWLLVLETGVMGVFTALDFFLFFLFWEVELIPMYLLISIWGSGRKEYSAMKFLIYTITGSALMLVGILVLYFSSPARTFDMLQLAESGAQPALLTSQAVFFLLFFAYAVKLPVWPLHTWLPDAHTDAPTAVSIMLAGVLLKMGGYAMIRVSVNMFPEVASSYSWLFASLAVINILYGAVVTMKQQDMKRMIAYSSVSHMGYVLLGISSMGKIGLTGASLQMFTHGTITGLLFLMAGLIYDKAHTRHIPDLGGLASRMPLMAVVFTIAGLASLGLPTTSGFVAELTVFLGTFSVWRVATILGVIGIVLTAGYMLWMLQRIMFGPEKERFAKIGDATAVETVPMLALVAAIMVVGIYPRLLLDVFSAGIAPIIGRLG
ncbi:MAG: NADH-quinone oxidoreductase subunit M [Chloroflexi bacterium]|nr:NADH-quinone oxidoreductase subunit M [Chloroflexota bacterium]